MSSHLGGIATTTSWMETCLPSVYSSLEPAVCIICLRNVSWPKHVSNILLWAPGQRSIHRPISPLALVSTRCCPSTARPLSGRTSDARGTFHEKNDLQNGRLDVIPMLQHFGCQTVSPKFHCHILSQDTPGTTKTKGCRSMNGTTKSAWFSGGQSVHVSSCLHSGWSAILSS